MFMAPVVHNKRTQSDIIDHARRLFHGFLCRCLVTIVID